MSQFKRALNNQNSPKLDANDLDRIHRCLLFLLKEVVDVCNRYDLKPFVICGNLIGKVRHNGFIPWDDDLDIGLLREDYDRFVDIFKQELADRFLERRIELDVTRASSIVLKNFNAAHSELYVFA